MKMKACSKCTQVKSLDLFWKTKKTPDGHRSQCIDCHSRVNTAWKQSHKAEISVQQKTYYQQNKEQIRTKNSLYWANNLDKHAAKAAKRRANKLHATPQWLTKDQLNHIQAYYETARLLTRAFVDQPMDVDHIIPLNGKDVCGLHVPWNLQIMDRRENHFKSNKVTHES
jgi:hypothetical protein